MAKKAVTKDEMLEERREVWHAFVRLVIYSTAATVLSLALLALFLL